MSKNIFMALANDSDSEDDNLQNKPPKRATKKEQRKTDKVLRQAHGDYVSRDQRPKGKPKESRGKDNYGPGQKRPYERHSGTGKPAFRKGSFKKGGHGKGNAGEYETEKKYQHLDGKTIEKKIDENLDNLEGQENLLKEEPVEIVTLDEYINNTGAKFGIKKGERVQNKDPRVFEDENTKAIVSKRSLRDAIYPKRKISAHDTKTFTKNIVQIDTTGQKKMDKKRHGKKNKMRFDKEEFPELE